jgi:hypothetical protein
MALWALQPVSAVNGAFISHSPGRSVVFEVAALGAVCGPLLFLSPGWQMEDETTCLNQP